MQSLLLTMRSSCSCRTCPVAHCEDCLPEGEIAAVGPSIPEFVFLGYGEVSQAYWVHCRDCSTKFETDEEWKQEWAGEDEIVQAKLASMSQ
jgi:SWI/SNF-related matrix-associated actin-dependent regulator of chromatin subfamily A member 5